MSLSPTNWRTVPDVSVLSITLGTPSGSARIAAVAIDGSGRAAEAEHTAELTRGVGVAGEARGARRRKRHRLASIGTRA